MQTKFENKVAAFIKESSLIRPEDKIVLAVSGGADSTALLYSFCSLKTKGILTNEFFCAHINHRLRGSDADADENFVIAQANKLNLPVVTKKIDVRSFAKKNKLSVETAARKLRIETLLDIAKTNNCSCIATAHQKNDNAETLIQRLIRGTGYRGLGGICPKRKFAENISFIRPLLSISRDEILDYLKKQKLNYCTDQTNFDLGYRRNFIRHRLIPALQKKCSLSLIEQLFYLSQSSQQFYKLICTAADKAWSDLALSTSDKVTLDLKKFQNQPKPVKVELIRHSLLSLGSGEKNLTQSHYRKILQFAEQNKNNKKIELPADFLACFEYDKLIFQKTSKAVPTRKHLSESIELKIPGQTSFSDCLIEAALLDIDNCDINKFKSEKNQFVEWFDFDSIKFPLIVRFRRDGDRFWPLTLPAEKKVGKFLTTEKVPATLRKKILVVADNEKVVWLWPVRIDERVKITNTTKKIFQLKITNTSTKQ